MNELREKIQKQSKVVLILAKVARIILYVAIALTIVAFVYTFFPSDETVFTLFGVKVTPLILMEGKTPADARLALAESLLTIALVLVVLFQVTKLFERIGESETPFVAPVIRGMKTVAVALGILVTIDNGYLGVVIGFALYAFAMIFEYGGELQKQVDETL